MDEEYGQDGKNDREHDIDKGDAVDGGAHQTGQERAK